MLTVEKYEHQHDNCDGMCDIEAAPSDTEMPCVTCPFCKEVVTAKLTTETISCPNCLVTVKRV